MHRILLGPGDNLKVELQRRFRWSSTFRLFRRHEEKSGAWPDSSFPNAELAEDRVEQILRRRLADDFADGVHRDPQRRHSYAKATARAEHAEALVDDLQNKVAELLGRTLPAADGPNGTRFGGDAVP